jgi:hypothetical protein
MNRVHSGLEIVQNARSILRIQEIALRAQEMIERSQRNPVQQNSLMVFWPFNDCDISRMETLFHLTELVRTLSAPYELFDSGNSEIALDNAINTCARIIRVEDKSTLTDQENEFVRNFEYIIAQSEFFNLMADLLLDSGINPANKQRNLPTINLVGCAIFACKYQLGDCSYNDFANACDMNNIYDINSFDIYTITLEMMYAIIFAHYYTNFGASTSRETCYNVLHSLGLSELCDNENMMNFVEDLNSRDFLSVFCDIKKCLLRQSFYSTSETIGAISAIVKMSTQFMINH